MALKEKKNSQQRLFVAVGKGRMEEYSFCNGSETGGFKVQRRCRAVIKNNGMHLMYVFYILCSKNRRHSSTVGNVPTANKATDYRVNFYLIIQARFLFMRGWRRDQLTNKGTISLFTDESYT